MSKLVGKRISPINKRIETLSDILGERTCFVGDRIAFSQVILLLITGILTYIIGMLDLSTIILSFWYILVLILPISIIIIIIKKRKNLWYNHKWSFIILPVFVVWVSLTLCIGVAIDYFLGLGKTLYVCIFLSLYYFTGYIFGRTIRNFKALNFETSIFKPVFWASIVLIVVPLIIGGIMLDFEIKTNNITSFYIEDYGKFSSCFSCALSIFIMLSGVGIVFSMILNWLLLSGLSEGKAKHHIVNTPPNKLIFLNLVGTAIFIGIVWIFMELLIPPIVGGGGGGGGSGGGGGGNSRTGNKYSVVDKENRIEIEWKKNKL